MNARQQAVLEPATRLLAVNPRASMQDIAAAAGISRATLHRLYPSRDALIEAIALVAVEKITAAYAAARMKEGTVLEALERLVTALVPLVYQFVDLSPAWLPYALSGLFLGAAEAVRQGDVAPREAARLILQTFLGGVAAACREDAASPLLNTIERISP
jgi:AcrR family transcriptional regulator